MIYEQGTLGEREAYDIIDKEGKHLEATDEIRADPSEPSIHHRLSLAALGLVSACEHVARVWD
jgi:hypothetical protein